MCDNYFMDHLDAQQTTSEQYNRSLGRKLILPIIVFLTVIGMIVPILCLKLGFSITGLNLLYLPIVITCINFPKRGIIFTSGIAVCYFLLLVLSPSGSSLVLVALIKMTGMEIVALLIINLSNKKNKNEKDLEQQRVNLLNLNQVTIQTLTRELEQSRRIETVSRATMEQYELCIKQIRMYYVQWNSELYITRTNDPFEVLVGRVKSDLVGRRISTLPWLEEASRKHETASVIIPVTGPDQKTHSVLWIFTDMFNEDSDIPFMTVGTGIEIPEE